MGEQIIYQSHWGSAIPQPEKPQNVWDFMRSAMSQEALTSREPRCIGVESGENWTLSQILNHTETLAKYLVDSFDGRRSTWNRADANVDPDVITVGILSPNTPFFPIVSYSCMAAGLPVVPLPVGSSSSEIAYLVLLAQCEIVFTHPSQLEIIKRSGYPPERIILTEPFDEWGGQTLADLLVIGEKLPTITDGKHSIPKHEVAIVFFSSGTTGNPKAVMITHRNVCALLTSLALKAGPNPSANFSRGITLGQLLSEKENCYAISPANAWSFLFSNEFQIDLIFFNPQPRSHVYGFFTGVLSPLLDGATQCIIRRWDVKAVFRAIAQYNITTIGIVPAMALQIISAADRLENVDLSSLTSITVGSSTINAIQKQKLFELLAARGALIGELDGSAIIEGYGMSEALAITTWSKDGTPAGRARLGTVGFLLPGCEARTISEFSDSPSGEDVPKYTAGELCLRSPTIMKGYLGNPEATRATFTSDGWLRTGDRMRIDTEGQLIYFDRLKDTFKNRGKQVSPAEISSLIYKHHSDLIAELAVIGVPAQGDSQFTGEEAWAFVALKVSSLSEKDKRRLAESIKTITREQLSIHKWVARVEFLDELPKSKTYKTLVRSLRDVAINIPTEKSQAKL